MITPNQFFDHIYVANLPRRTDRRGMMASRLQQWGIEAEFVAAIDGATPQNQREYAAYARRPLFTPDAPRLEWELKRKLFTSPGAWACNKTFYGILADAKHRGFGNILILEDDAVFHKNFATLFDQLAQSIPRDWQVFFLGASQLEWKIPEALRHPAADGGEAVPYYYPVKTNGSFALGLQCETFDPLLEDLVRMECPFDAGPLRTFVRQNPGRCIVAQPNLIIADVAESDIRPGLQPVRFAKRARWDLDQYERRTPITTDKEPPPGRSIASWVEKGLQPTLQAWLKKEQCKIWLRHNGIRNWIEQRHQRIASVQKAHSNN